MRRSAVSMRVIITCLAVVAPAPGYSIPSAASEQSGTREVAAPTSESSRTGEVRVTVTGLPNGATGKVRVNPLEGRRSTTTVAGTVVLRGLGAGRARVRPLRVRRDGKRWYPVPRMRTVRITPRERVRVHFRYRRALDDVVAVGSSGVYTCAVRVGGRVHCWGLVSVGVAQEAAVPRPGVSGVAAVDGSCHLFADGTAGCMGGPVFPDAVDMAQGRGVCAVRGDGEVWCAERRYPAVYGFRMAPLPGLRATHVDIGRSGTQDLVCTVTVERSAVCFPFTGWDFPPEPRQVPGIGPVVDVGPGGRHACAVMADGWVACWGLNPDGRLGDGTTTSSDVPRRVVGITDAVEVVSGSYHSCARHVDGRISCWGHNPDGRLGNGTRVGSTVPVQVASRLRFTALDAGDEHTCALAANGKVYCWGSGFSGRLGNGTTLASATPSLVLRED